MQNTVLAFDTGKCLDKISVPYELIVKFINVEEEKYKPRLSLLKNTL